MNHFASACVFGLLIAGFTHLTAEKNDTLKSFEKIVVTGTKTEKSLDMTPVKTDVYDKDDIEKFAACNLYQVLDRTPGIRMEQQCNNCNFSLMRMSGLEGGYAKVLIDGMPVYSGLAGVYGMQQIQAGLIEQIEIVKGAGSALYGSDAIAGVVNIITRKPGPKPELTIGASLGMNPIYDETKEGNIPLSSSVNFSASHRKGNFAALIAGQSNTAQEIDNNADLATDRVNSKNLGGTTKLSWYDLIGDKSTLSFMGRAIYENRKGGSIKKDANGNFPIDDALSPLGPGSEHITTERYEGGLTLEKEFESKTLIKIMANAISHARNATNGAAWEKIVDSLTVTPENIEDVASMLPKPFLTNERTVVGELNVAQPFGETNTALVGIQVKRTDVEENINGDRWIERYFQDVGLFLQDEWEIVKQFGFVAGVRYDMHQSEDESSNTDYDENAVNPRVSLRFTPVEPLVTRFSWGMGFRVPGDFSEDAHLCASAPTIQKTNALKPERSMSFSLSGDFEKDRFAVGLSLFRTNIDDKVFLDEYTGNDTTEDGSAAFDLEWTNAEGAAFTQGFEISAGYELDFFEIGGSYVLNQAQFEEEQIEGNEDSKNIPRAPLHSGNINIALFSNSAGESFTDGWRLDLGLNIVGSMFIERDGEIVDAAGDYDLASLEEIVETDPYVLLDMRINKRINPIGLDVYIAAENLTNTVQEREEWDVDDAAMIFAPLYGPTFTLGFKKDF